jgi:class 3 adenylate cyclase
VRTTGERVVRSTAERLCSSVGPRYEPSRFTRFTLGLRKCRQEPPRQEAVLQYDIDNSSSLRDFLSPLNRLVAIIERLLPVSIEADFVLGHGAPDYYASPE